MKSIVCGASFGRLCSRRSRNEIPEALYYGLSRVLGVAISEMRAVAGVSVIWMTLLLPHIPGRVSGCANREALTACQMSQART